jgi:hypothetical protein
MVLNLPGSDPYGIKGNDLVFDVGDILLALLDD